jgi:putative hydrolase of the HAD superfamily
MALRAVIFDYGLVLSGPADPQAHAALLRRTGLSHKEFEERYWLRPERQLYDKGQMTGLEYWRNFMQQIHKSADEKEIAELTLIDAQMWTTENPATVAWARQLKAAGIRTAILSNMGDAIARNIQQNLPWVHEFDHQIWSYTLKTGKPAPEIYLHTLSLLGTKPQETLFIDDRQRNLDGAKAVGMETYLFRGVEQLRLDLTEDLQAWGLPIPSLESSLC